MRLPIACLALCALVLAACGVAPVESVLRVDRTVNGRPPPTSGTLAALLGLPSSAQIDTPDVLVTSGTDYAPAPTRVPIGLLHKDGTQFQADGGKIDVYLGTDGKSDRRPVRGHLLPIEGPGIKLAPEEHQGRLRRA